MLLNALCLFLFAISALAETPKNGQDLADAVLVSAKAQGNKLQNSQKVVSSIVKEDPPAALDNGDADISTTGACEADLDALCVHIPPGESRLADCIAQRMRDEADGNVKGRRVADECRKEVGLFFVSRAQNINKNLQLASACKDDVSKFCKDEQDSGEGGVLACLRKNRRKLSSTCKVQVLKAMIDAAKDFRADPQLAKVCKDDATRLCGDVPYGEGRVQDCMRSKPTELTPECGYQLFRQEIENSDDIRLSFRLYKSCRADQQHFCKDIPYGSNRIKDCLEENLQDPKFSSDCKAEMEHMMAQRATDYRLDPHVMDSCADDIKHVCGYKKQEVEADKGVHDGRVVMCLVDNHEDLTNDDCRSAVHQVMRRAAENIEFDEKLAQACFDDRKSHCADAQAGSARVIRCLQDNRELLKDNCRAALFDHETILAENIDFQFPLQQACSAELQKLCTKVKKGYARVIRCLHKYVGDETMGSECSAEVRRNMHRMSQDYRLNFRLKRSCKNDMATMCKNLCSPHESCGGTMLRCLQDNMEKIGSPECKDEVFYFVKMEVYDFKNDIMLAEACKGDTESLCKDVEPGEGRMLECLRKNRSSLTKKCRDEEVRISQIQARDVRLRPRLMKLCSEEMVEFCSDVKPGGGRMFTCLLSHASKPTFGGQCKVEVLKREDLAKGDYRMDAGVADACEGEVDEYCAEAKTASHGNAQVLKCLVDKMVDKTAVLNEECEVQMSRAVRMAFWDYKKQVALTLPCDQDVETSCPSTNRTTGVFSIGVVGRCLSKQLAQNNPLAPECRKLVTVAAPKDIRINLQEIMNSDGTMKTGFQSAIQSAATATSFITLNGWVAVLSVMASVFVLFAGALWAFRRASGLDKPHTRFVPVSTDDRRDLEFDES